MKRFLLLSIATSLVIGIWALLSNPAPARAFLDFTHTSGDFHGTVFRNGIDSDGDNLNGRSGLLRVTNSKWRFLEAHVDSTIDFEDPFQGCDPGVPRLFVTGTVVFTNWWGDSVHAKIDDQNYCLDGSTETVTATVIGGTGDFEGQTGSGTLSLPDDRVLDIELVDGIWPFPTVVFVNDGHFELVLD